VLQQPGCTTTEDDDFGGNLPIIISEVDHGIADHIAVKDAVSMMNAGSDSRHRRCIGT
jgi:hypothetical protein